MLSCISSINILYEGILHIAQLFVHFSAINGMWAIWLTLLPCKQYQTASIYPRMVQERRPRLLLKIFWPIVPNILKPAYTWYICIFQGLFVDYSFHLFLYIFFVQSSLMMELALFLETMLDPLAWEWGFYWLLVSVRRL